MSESNLIYTAYGQLGIIALESAKDLGEKVDSHIIKRRTSLKHFAGQNESSVPESYLISASELRFSNGEGKVVLNESVRGKDIFIICDVGNYSSTYSMYGRISHKSPDEHFQDIKRTLSAIAGKARRTVVIMPLLYSSRQHRRKGRESMDCAMALQDLEGLGVGAIVTFDVHDPNIQNAIPLTSFENIYPTYDIIKTIIEEENDLIINKNNMLVIAPDTGAMDRAVYYSSVLKLDIGLFYKRRDHTKMIAGKNPIISHQYIGKSVEGMDILIVDDMIASGESVLDIAYELKRRNAKNIFVASTFAMFTEGVDKFNSAYEQGFIKGVYSTNLTYVAPEARVAPWYKAADLSEFIGKIIDYLNYDRSLSGLLDATKGINEVLKKYKQ